MSIMLLFMFLINAREWKREKGRNLINSKRKQTPRSIRDVPLARQHI